MILDRTEKVGDIYRDLINRNPVHLENTINYGKRTSNLSSKENKERFTQTGDIFNCLKVDMTVWCTCKINDLRIELVYLY